VVAISDGYHGCNMAALGNDTCHHHICPENDWGRLTCARAEQAGLETPMGAGAVATAPARATGSSRPAPAVQLERLLH